MTLSSRLTPSDSNRETFTLTACCSTIELEVIKNERKVGKARKVLCPKASSALPLSYKRMNSAQLELNQQPKVLDKIEVTLPNHFSLQGQIGIRTHNPPLLTTKSSHSFSHQTHPKRHLFLGLYHQPPCLPCA